MGLTAKENLPETQKKGTTAIFVILQKMPEQALVAKQKTAKFS
jgi:hypothetical protein